METRGVSPSVSQESAGQASMEKMGLAAEFEARREGFR
jgi:hypothetical protein